MSDLGILETLEGRLLFATTRLAVIGDYSADDQTQPVHDVASLVNSWSPAAVVTVGDNNYPNGAASTIDANIGQWYHQYISPYKGSFGAGSADGQNHFWPVLGNHDWNTTNAQPYLDYFTLPNNERYYTARSGMLASSWSIPMRMSRMASPQPACRQTGFTRRCWHPRRSGSWSFFTSRPIRPAESGTTSNFSGHSKHGRDRCLCRARSRL